MIQVPINIAGPESRRLAQNLSAERLQLYRQTMSQADKPRREQLVILRLRPIQPELA